jgi:hypothetical protein
VNRAEVAAFVGERYGAYLAAVGRSATDSAGNLKSAIDDALRALGYATVDLPTAEPTDPEGEEDLRVQVAYRTMAQVSRDLGATNFDITVPDGSFKLSQLRAAAEADLVKAANEVSARFGTLGVVLSDSDTPFGTMDLNFLEDEMLVEAV